MKILIISDAGHPQINGVVRTLEQTARELARLGHQTRIVTPDPARWCSLKMPFYREITLEFFAHRRLSRLMRDFAPDFIHIATEGPLGCAARSVCLREERPFTTSYHTRFPEYFAARAPRFLAWPVSALLSIALRRFHAPAAAIMVATDSIERELRGHRFHRIARWSRGVDTDLFHPDAGNISPYGDWPRPILLYVGRVSVEKNLREFLELRTAGTLVVIGDGPDMHSLRARYPQARFLGAMQGAALARHYAAADLFVFPSTTDTFGLVLLEACASGLRVAAKDAPGPRDIFADPATRNFAALDDDLQQAVTRALSLRPHPAAARAFAATFSWAACTRQFFTHLQAPSPQAKKRLLRWRQKIGDGI